MTETDLRQIIKFHWRVFRIRLKENMSIKHNDYNIKHHISTRPFAKARSTLGDILHILKRSSWFLLKIFFKIFIACSLIAGSTIFIFKYLPLSQSVRYQLAVFLFIVAIGLRVYFYPGYSAEKARKNDKEAAR